MSVAVPDEAAWQSLVRSAAAAAAAPWLRPTCALATAACPAVFVSGGGSNFRAIHAAIQEGSIYGEVAVVVSNAPTCAGVAYAQSHGIPTLTYPAPKSDPAAGLTAEQLVQQLTQVGAAPGRATSAARAGCLCSEDAQPAPSRTLLCLEALRPPHAVRARPLLHLDCGPLPLL